jgi:hypothetical protein
MLGDAWCETKNLRMYLNIYTIYSCFGLSLVIIMKPNKYMYVYLKTILGASNYII